MKLIDKAANIFDRLNDLLALMATVLLAFLMLSVTYSVVIRYFWGFTTFGLFEIWQYSLLYIPFLGVAWLLKREGHINMDVVLIRLKPKAQAILNGITSILSALTCLALIWGGTLMTWESFRAGHRIIGELFPPEFLILMIIPIGSFLFFIQFLRRTYGYFGGQRIILGKEDKVIV